MPVIWNDALCVSSKRLVYNWGRNETEHCFEKTAGAREMKIEAGKRYVRRDGKVSGVIAARDAEYYCFEDSEGYQTYTENGSCIRDGKVSPYDLVSEYVEPSDMVNHPPHYTSHPSEYIATGEKTTAADYLNDAARIMAERGKQYDSPEGERSMGKTVLAFNAVTGRDLTESEGWLLMLLLKQVRQFQNKPHLDSAQDAVAYAALLAESRMGEGA